MNSAKSAKIHSKIRILANSSTPVSDSKVKYAWIAWAVYSAVLVGKIATCFRIFHEQVRIHQESGILQKIQAK